MMKSLSELMKSWARCTECPLALTRTHVVFGEPYVNPEGSSLSLYLIVGEAPGKHEDLSGRPFVGQAGEILREEILPKTNIKYAFTTNLLACRPLNNRNPHKEEIDSCVQRLNETVEILKPDALIIVGKQADQAIDYPWRKYFDDKPQISILHPAALLYQGHPNPQTRQRVQVQIAKINRLIEKLDSSESIGVGCVHDFEEVGHWWHVDKERLPLYVCTKCGTMLGPGEST